MTASSRVRAPARNRREARADVRLLLSESDSFCADGRSAQPGRRIGDRLTAREREVLGMIGQGFTNKRIARNLEISPETVKSHVKRIFLKLAVSTRAEAVSRAGTLDLL
ncbi:MAG TPA: LuxR C-terminal-related transcriptional regulator [Pseudolabrys sp.]|nr:LuxR C-terminal-related transcriptional regulator [Pseudolabrys sp.]